MGSNPIARSDRDRHSSYEASSPIANFLQGDVAKSGKARVCKTPIRRFKSDRRLFPIDRFQRVAGYFLKYVILRFRGTSQKPTAR